MKRHLIINFVGNFAQAMSGESADEIILARDLEKLGHKVQRVPRDIWKAHVDGLENNDWLNKLPIKADLTIICKWNHFNHHKYIKTLKKYGMVFYWTWDWMRWPENGWHKDLCQAADVHLTNEGGQIHQIPHAYYFNFDIADGELPFFINQPKKYDLVFFGSCVDAGDRKKYLPELAKMFSLQIFAADYQNWQKMGLNAKPPVWGVDFNEIVSQSKICLHFSVNDDIWGYWSNRVGKVLAAGGFLLAKYTPGMELFLRDGADYFSSLSESIDKISYYLQNDEQRETIGRRGLVLGRDKFTSLARVRELEIILDRCLIKK